MNKSNESASTMKNNSSNHLAAFYENKNMFKPN